MKRKSFRAAQRGAVFVESIVVLSFFILCFLGVLYFREVYLAKLRVQRLARASAMAHAMGACNVDAKAGIEKDLPNPPAREGEPLTRPDIKAEGKAKEAIDDLSSSKGGPPLAEITKITVVTKASATTRQDQQAQETGFRSDVGSASFVTCMDPVSDEDVIAIVPRMQSIIESFL